MRPGYDCVAAPWIRRRVYDLPLLGGYLAWRRRRAERRGRSLRQSLYGRIGNGGLSLRRVESFRRACERYRETAEHYLARPHHLHNEDVFWALVPDGFRYPAWKEALGFSFDTNPAYCWRLTGGRLPMGCHSWSETPHVPLLAEDHPRLTDLASACGRLFRKRVAFFAQPLSAKHQGRCRRKG